MTKGRRLKKVSGAFFGVGVTVLLLLPTSSAAARVDDFFRACPADFSIVAERTVPQDNLRVDPPGLRDKWYARCLAALGEPPLGPVQGVDESYRLFWHDGARRAVAVRLQSTAEGFRIVSREVSGPSRRDEAGHDEGRTRSVSAEVWQGFLTRLASMEFWRLPSKEERCLHCRGGTVWVLEGYRHGRSHVLHRRAPWELEDSVRDAGLYLWQRSSVAPAVSPRRSESD